MGICFRPVHRSRVLNSLRPNGGCGDGSSEPAWGEGNLLLHQEADPFRARRCPPTSFLSALGGA
eukprot:7795194-Pyramimonas_sp.AAC.1